MPEKHRANIVLAVREAGMDYTLGCLINLCTAEELHYARQNDTEMAEYWSDLGDEINDLRAKLTIRR